MERVQGFSWIRICLFNLLVVSLFGVLMRYKIGFEFPFFDQKNLQHAHSHFAFTGWISLILMVLMVKAVEEVISLSQKKYFNIIFISYLICSFGMLISFSMQGYGLFSIFFSTTSIFISFWFCVMYFKVLRKVNFFPGKFWLAASLLFNIISALGTFYLSYLMASRQINQHTFMASVYWYLHFQYNGWFFFACTGLFLHYLQSKKIYLKNERIIFWLFAVSCIPAYGLSILWLKLPLYGYILVVLAAFGQFFGFLYFTADMKRIRLLRQPDLDIVARLLFLFVFLALFIKLSLQLGSTIPAVSKFAFGFRSIVIAYLHLVLLAFTSVFLILYLYVNRHFRVTLPVKTGILIFVCGIILNELILAIQGIGSLSYTIVPYSNELLFGVSILMLAGLFVLNTTLKPGLK